jgi:hypothetical protein
VINPADYELAPPIAGEPRWYQAGPYMDNRRVGMTCDHCGHSLRYYVRHIYKPTGQVVIFGEDCADLIGVADSRAAYEFNKLRERARKDEREAKLAKEKSERTTIFSRQYPDLIEFLEINNWDLEKMYFLKEMNFAFNNYGYLTTGQAEATRRILAKRVEQAAERLAEPIPTTSAPTGRQHVKGMILSTKLVNTMYGEQLKMLVKLEDGNKVYGSVPSDIRRNLDDPYNAHGTKVSFSATFEQSRDDEHFGFFKRPTQSEVIQ